MVPVIAVLNMKGGVGKTTLACNVFREIFAWHKKSVLLIDLDPQFNLSQQLLERNRYNSLVDEKRTTLRLFESPPASEFFEVNMDDETPPSAKELSVQLRYLVAAPDKGISTLAGTFELTKYSFIEDQTKLKFCKDFFKRSISKAKKEFDLIVLDMNPSASFLTLCGLSVATDVLSPVRPDKFSVLGLELVRKLIEHPMVDSDLQLHVVMNGVERSAGMTEIE